MQRRLYTHLAATYAYAFALNWIRQIYAKKNQTADDVKNVHVMASGIKGMLICFINCGMCWPDSI